MNILIICLLTIFWASCSGNNKQNVSETIGENSIDTVEVQALNSVTIVDSHYCFPKLTAVTFLIFLKIKI